MLARGRRVLQLEAEGIAALVPRLGEEFARACQTLLQCRGRVIVSGIGKSGHVARKIAATFASTDRLLGSCRSVERERFQP